MGIRKLTIVMVWMAIVSMNAQNVREVTRLNEGWRFALGNASDPVKDFGCGTEYFNRPTPSTTRARIHRSSAMPAGRRSVCRTTG